MKKKKKLPMVKTDGPKWSVDHPHVQPANQTRREGNLFRVSGRGRRALAEGTTRPRRSPPGDPPGAPG